MKPLDFEIRGDVLFLDARDIDATLHSVNIMNNEGVETTFFENGVRILRFSPANHSPRVNARLFDAGAAYYWVEVYGIDVYRVVVVDTQGITELSVSDALAGLGWSSVRHQEA